MYAELHDGRRLEFPDGTDPAIVQATVKKMLAPSSDNQPPEQILEAAGLTPQQHRLDIANTIGGLIRGAGSIGSTLLMRPEEIGAKIKGQPAQQDDQRRADMDAALRNLGADTDSLAFKIPKMGAEVAGTMGAGGAVANTVGRIAPGVAAKIPAVLDAIRTAGMTSAGAAGKAGVAVRALGGGINGAVSAGMVDPSAAGTGATIGAVLPPVLQGLGRVGSAVGNVARNVVAPKSGTDIARALDLTTPQDIQAVIAQLRAAAEIVPGSKPTVAQALGTPQAGILQRVVGDSAGGGALRDRLAAQAQARLAALEGVAPTVPTGFRTAQQDLGEAVGRSATAADAAARAKTRGLYEAVPQDEAALYLPELAAVRDRYFGPGSFTSRAGADKAVSTAQEIGTVELPGVTAAKTPGSQPLTLSQAVRRAGGLSVVKHDNLRGELLGLRGDLKNLVRVNGGQSPGHMARAMHEAGYLPDQDAQTLLAALRDDATGLPQFSNGADLSRMVAAGREAAMGEAPAAGRVPQKVTLREFDNLRKSIGSTQRAAERDPERVAEAAALGDMKKALDDRLNEVVRGDGAADENLPIAWADALDAARKAKQDQVARFRTGPQATMFRTGADGQPTVQGGEVAAKFWGNRPGLADDVDSFRRLIDDNPRLLGQFRSMITTEGAGTGGAGGALATKFARWVDNMMPGLQRAFEPDQVGMLQRIAQDIKRSEAAAAAGMARGSNTYQNAQNALGLGLLDNSAVKAAAEKIPVVGRGVTWLQSMARDAKAKRLAGVLSDADAAAAALQASGQRTPPAQLNPAVRALFYRPAPVLAADR